MDAPKEVTSSDDKAEEYTLFTLKGGASTRIKVDMQVDEHNLVMELDTGASRSVISEATYRRYFQGKPFMKGEVKLRTYSGHEVQVRGELQVVVRYHGQQEDLSLLVVEGDGPSLLGRDWLSKLRLNWQQIFIMQAEESHKGLEKVLSQFKEVFNPNLGSLQGYTAKIHLEDNTVPRFYKARPVPIAIKPMIEKELDHLVEQKVLQPIEFADWAAPIVPVLKSDKKSIRICGDFKVTINQMSKLDRYPIPKVEDLFTALSEGKLFTKLDLSQAYQQVSLDEDSKKLVVINTHKGLFQYNRMPFGISSAPGIFQRVMESLLQGIPHVVVYLDNILITGKDDEEHLKSLEEVLSRLKKSGLRLKRDKCFFFQKEVEYLGYKIDANGLHPTEKMLQAIKDAPAPRNTAELKSYLGLLSYYGKFLPNLSQELAPLYMLLKNSTCWLWTQCEQSAFEKSKALLSSKSVLVHFDPSREILLACDASSYGIGAVLSHKMPDGSERRRPIAFASRTLSKAEKNYSQIEKEGLACVFGVKRFHTLCTATSLH